MTTSNSLAAIIGGRMNTKRDISTVDDTTTLGGFYKKSKKSKKSKTKGRSRKNKRRTMKRK